MDSTTPRLEMEQQVERVKPSFMEELGDFINELWGMIKSDFRNSINFISSNRSYFYTVAFLAVLLQFSSINNLGASFEKYCNKNLNLNLNLNQGNGGSTMKGGGNTIDMQSFRDIKQGELAAEVKAKADKKAAASEKRLQAKIDKKIAKKADKLADKIQQQSVGKDGSYKSAEQSRAEAEHQITEKAKQKKLDKKEKKMMDAARKESAKDYSQKEEERHEQDQLMKANKERLSFFEKIKGKIKGLTPTSGPLFSNLDLIFSSVKDIFYIILVLLVIVGVLSLPVMVFLIFTYYVFKIMIGKFLVL
jgi:hypothetical protein